ncbi:MAG: U32 family peptidase [Oscillospiraceae bacterium]|nr:U32 family peptidase [Oscillospiraceae bacterium]
MPELELLCPAGDMECLRTALRFGADAVYVGGPKLQLRAANAGFSMDDLALAAREVHALGRRLYVTVNAFPTNAELDALGGYARDLHALGADAAIVADMGAVAVMRRAAPDLPIHVSTQANCVNWAAATAWYEMGASRVVLGREMTLAQIAELRARTPAALELEAFVHGAMCMAWSGRCMISAFLTGRSANRGACTQSCRWRYHLVEEKRPGEFFPVEEDERGATILSSHDLNCMDFLDRIADAGITSFKIEGRMKSPYYVATVANAYRQRLDALAGGPADPGTLALLRRELDAVSHRAYASGFYFGEMKRHAPDDGVYHQDCLFVGVVRQRLGGGRVRVELRNRVRQGDALEILAPGRLGQALVAERLALPDGTPLDQVAEPMTLFDMDAPAWLEAGDMLRRRLP